MNKESFYESRKSDKNFIRGIALKYVEYEGNMAAVDVDLGSHIGFIDALMYEDQELAEELQEAIDVIVSNRLDREAAIRKIKLIETLNDIVSDTTLESDGGPTIRDKVSAANLLCKLTETDKPKQRVEKRSLDDLL